MKKDNKAKEYRIKKNKYYTITIIIAAIFLVFELIVNMDYFLNLFVEKEKQQAQVEKDELEEWVFSEYANTNNTYDIEYLIYSDSLDLDLETTTQNVLKNQKRGFKKIEALTGLAEATQTLFVIQNEIDEQEIEALISYAESGHDIVFLKMPNESSMKQETLLSLLGIYKNKGFTTHQGIRFVPNFFVTNELMEVEDVLVKMYECELMQKTRTFSYTLALDEEEYEDVDNEYLPPTIWRNSSFGGNVYAFNADFRELGCYQGVFTALFSYLSEDDIYPVINGYSVIISGLPYVKSGMDERLETLYSRDAMGMQQDLLFPTLISNAKKEQYRPTFFCRIGDFGSVDSDFIEAQFSYMQKEIKGTSGEVGLYYDGSVLEQDLITVENSLFDDGKMNVPYTVLRKVDTVVSVNSNDSNFIRRETKDVVLPVVRQDVYNETTERLKEISYVTECAMLSVLIDVETVFENEDEKYNWENYSKQFDTVIGGHNEYYGSLGRLAVDDVATRVLEYTVMNPTYTMEEDSITINIEHFSGEAYFILRTEKEIVDMTAGSFTPMGEDAYLIHVTEEDVEIELKKERDIF